MHVAFFIYGNCCGNLFLKDSAEYVAQSENILNHGTWYSGNMDETVIPQMFSQRPPIYGFFILLLHFLVNNILIISIVQSLLSLFNIFIAYRIVKTLAIKLLNPFLFLIPFLFFPSQFIYANMVMPEMLLQSCVMLAVYFLLMYLKENQLSSFVFYQLAITAALLVKPVFFIFPLFSLAFFLIVEKNIQHKLRSAFGHLIPVIAILVVSFVNAHHTGYFEYSSIPRKLMINYSARYSAAFNHGDTFALQQIESIEQNAAQLRSYPEKAGYVKNAAMDIIKENPGAFALLTIKGVANFFLDHSRYDLESFSGNIPAENITGWRKTYNKDGWKGVIAYITSFNPFYYTYLLISMFVNLILLIGLFHFARMKEIPLPIRLVILFLIFYVAIMTGMTGTTRFRLPVFLLIVIANSIVWGQKYFLIKSKSTTM